MEQIHIRQFDYPADYQAVRSLWASAGAGIQLGRSDEPAEIYKKVQRDPDLFLLAEEGDNLVGAVMGGFDGRRGMVYHLAVAESYRRRGVGRMMMAELEKRLREKGCIRCYLLVTNGNAQALHFYNEIGWMEMDLHILARDLA
ncbi:MAG: GNAT family N-acetyltransferase [Chloroflexi bacterium]|nr:GNAT family N-acetyltransferase [Chloroflexota bacterium]